MSHHNYNNHSHHTHHTPHTHDPQKNQKRDFYEILGISKKASTEEIKKAYKQMALKYHPDRNKEENATELFKEISEAYSVLSNEDTRKKYDLYGGDSPDFDDLHNAFSQNFANHFFQFTSNFGNFNANNGDGTEFDIDELLKKNNFPFPTSFGSIHIKIKKQNGNKKDEINDKMNGHQTNSERNLLNEIFREYYNEYPDSEVSDSEKSSNSDNILNNMYNMHKHFGKDDEDESVSSTEDSDTDSNGGPTYEMDINYNIKVSLKNIYNKETKNVVITRIRKSNKKELKKNSKKNGKKQHNKDIYLEKRKKIKIPIYDKELLLENMGNQYKTSFGNVYITIHTQQNKNFKRINDYDVLTYKHINLNDIYTDIMYEIKLPNKKVLKVQCPKNSLVTQFHPVQKITGHGIPYKTSHDEEEYIYGDLFVMYYIHYTNDCETTELLDINSENVCDESVVAYNTEFENICCFH